MATLRRSLPLLILLITPIYLLTSSTKSLAANLPIYEDPVNGVAERAPKHSADENQKQNAADTANVSGYVYSLILRNRTPRVKPGDTLEIEVYLSGFGIPEKNKLFIYWSSPNVIDPKSLNPVSVTFINFVPNIVPERYHIPKDSPTYTVQFDSTGARFSVPKPYFMMLVGDSSSNSSSQFPGIGADHAWVSSASPSPPLLVTLNTSKAASSGDFDVTFVFTYGNEQNPLQDYKITQFHITSWLERNQWWIAIIGSVGVVASLVFGARKLLVERAKLFPYLTHWESELKNGYLIVKIQLAITNDSRIDNSVRAILLASREDRKFNFEPSKWWPKTPFSKSWIDYDGAGHIEAICPDDEAITLPINLPARHTTPGWLGFSIEPQYVRNAKACRWSIKITDQDNRRYSSPRSQDQTFTQ